MKHFLLFSLLFALFLSAKAQEERVPVHVKENKIKSCEIIKSFLSSKDSMLTHKYVIAEYDSSGRMLSWKSHWYHENKLKYIEKKKYGVYGNKIEVYTRDVPLWTNDETRFHNQTIKKVSKYNEKNQLIELKSYSASFDIDSLTEEDYRYSIFKTYNDRDLLIHQKQTNGERTEIRTYEYDRVGNMIMETCEDCQYEADSIRYIYNSNNKLIKELSYSGGKNALPYILEYSYAKDGTLNKKVKYERNGDPSSHNIYIYDDTLILYEEFKTLDNRYNSFHIIDSLRYDSLNRYIWYKKWEQEGRGSNGGDFSGNLVKTKQVYDDKKRVIEEKKYLYRVKRGLFQHKSKYTYNNLDQIEVEKAYNRSGALQKTFAYKYDSKGNCIKKRVLDKNQKLLRYYDYKFNNKNLCTEEAEYDENGNLVDKYTYKYDSLKRRIWRDMYNSKGEYWRSQAYQYEGNNTSSYDRSIFYDAPKITIMEYTYNHDNTYKEIKVYDGEKLLKTFTYNYQYW